MNREMLVLLAFWALIALCLLKIQSDVLFTGQLKDSDDYMRLVQVLDFIGHWNWYDIHQERLNPPDGLAMHWTRLPDLPLALTIVAAEPALGRPAAMVLAAVAVPLLLLLGLFVTHAWVMRPLVGRSRLESAIFVLPAGALSLLPYFSPGRVDHHNWQLLFAYGLIGAALRVCLARDPSGKAGLVAGVTGGLSLWVGGEAVLTLALVCGVMTIGWVRHGAALRFSLLAFGGSLMGTTLLVLPLALPPARWAGVACDTFSLVSLALAGAVLVFFALATASAALIRQPFHRLVLAPVLAAPVAATLALAFPHCLGGPYGAIEAELGFWLDNVGEAQSLVQVAPGDPGLAAGLSTVPLAGAVLAAWGAIVSPPRRRTVWLALLVPCVASLLLMALWQIRVAPFATLFALPPLALAIADLWRRAEALRLPPLRAFARTAPLAALLVIPMGAVEATSVMLPPPDKPTGRSDCTLEGAAGVLNDPQGLGDRPRRILNLIDMGPELLFRTPHHVLAAPYHRNGQALLDARRIWQAPIDAEARRRMAERGIELVVICATAPEVAIHTGAGHSTFLARLIDDREPEWLEALPHSQGSPVRLYRVRP